MVSKEPRPSALAIVIADVLDMIERDEALRARVRALVGSEASPPARSDVEFETIPAFATRVSASKRHIWNLVRSGLPTIGTGRARRVDVRRALEFLRGRDARRDGVIELDARRRARAVAARTASRGKDRR